MLSRFRRLEISLAAKCQILFGAAVVLIIASALAVPWHRMEQLTQQLDERAADALAEDARSRHIALHEARGVKSGDASALATPAPMTGPATQPSDSIPRLLAIGTDEPLTAFDRKAFNLFIRRNETGPTFRYYERPDGKSGYRFARPLLLTRACAACHSVSGDKLLTLTPAAPEPVQPAEETELDPWPEPATAPVVTASETPPATSPAAASSRRPMIGIVSIDMPSRIDPNQLLLNRFFILCAGLLAGLLAFIAFYLITTRLILQPVRVLRETAERVSEGDLNVRSDINTGDEFQQLSETFNVMLTNLKQSSDQLRSINKSLDLKLGQLAESNLALFESNRLKSEFLANVSHELRTPLNSILGFADLLKDNLASAAAPETKPGRYIGNILSSSKHLLDLINDLLDLAKIEAGRMEIRAEPLSLVDVFEGLVNLLRPLWEQKSLSLSTSVDPELPVIHTDPAKLQQVLYNFLSNAIKFSPAGSRIDLMARLEARPASGDGENGNANGNGSTAVRSVRISVTDHGPGIDPDQQQLIFEKFRQIDASVTRTHSGTGLGLAIAKELASLLGGSIGVRSAKGQGATFWILLPLQIESGDADVRGRLVWS
jgi:two-component system sensor histidine kinase BarA